MAHLTSNTSVEYPCLMCGTSGNIIREGPDPRIKCNNARCNFMYDGSDSRAAVEANSIPEKPLIADEPQAEPIHELGKAEPVAHIDSTGANLVTELFNRLPRTLRYLIVAKNRVGYEFCNEKQLRKVILKWEAAGKPYELFELTPKKVSANVDIK